jgi:lysozyme
MNQENLIRLVDQLKRHEGFRSTLYKCPAGHLTIGYGHNCDAHQDSSKFKDRIISETEAENLLLSDLSDTQKDCVKNIRSFNSLSEIQQAVLLNMTFNMGIGTILLFKSFLKNLSAGFKKGIAQEMINSTWCSQVGKRATELVYMILTDEFI